MLKMSHLFVAVACLAAFGCVAGVPQVELDLPAPTAIKDENDDDPNCLELAAVLDFYCNTDKCKDFYSKGCYNLVSKNAFMIASLIVGKYSNA